MSGENNPDFLPRDFPGRGFREAGAAASSRSQNPRISAPLPAGFLLPKGVVVARSSRGWKKR